MSVMMSRDVKEDAVRETVRKLRINNVDIFDFEIKSARKIREKVTLISECNTVVEFELTGLLSCESKEGRRAVIDKISDGFKDLILRREKGRKLAPYLLHSAGNANRWSTARL